MNILAQLRLLSLVGIVALIPQPTHAVTWQQLAKLGLHAMTYGTLYYGAKWYLFEEESEEEDDDDFFGSYYIKTNNGDHDSIVNSILEHRKNFGLHKSAENIIDAAAEILRGHLQRILDNVNDLKKIDYCMQEMEEANDFVNNLPEERKHSILQSLYNETSHAEDNRTLATMLAVANYKINNIKNR